MSIASPTDTDCITTITTMRNHNANGTQMSYLETRLALAWIENAIGRLGGGFVPVGPQYVASSTLDTTP